jgi:fructoselysine-6-P-deglycase FrlB-like protein
MNTFLADILAQPEALQSVLEYFTRTQPTALQQAADSLKTFPRLVLTSMGSAYYSLMPMHYVLARKHPCVHLMDTADLLRTQSFERTATIIMSRSGESGEISQYAEELQAQGSYTLAITMTPESSLAKHAAQVLYNPSPFDGFICTKAYTTLALTGLLLVSQWYGELTPQLVNNLAQAFAWLEENKEKLLAQVEALPWLGNSLTFLSQGAGMGLAMSGSLWAAEGARLRTDFSSVEQFRHGPVEQVDEQFYGVWIELEPNPFGRDYVKFMQQKGGTFCTISTGAAPGAQIAIPSFDLPEAYRILLAAMPVQMIAYQSGHNRGLQPGEMRYLNWVVK